MSVAVKYTEFDIREFLPDVKVEVDGEIVTGQVSGRREKFATVTVGASSWQFAWRTVAKAVNNETALIVG